MSLDDVLLRIAPPDRALLEEAQQRLDRLTKPPGSLGRLEALAAQYVMLTGRRQASVPRSVVYTFAADHGIVQEGVSAYPQAVTAQMVVNFLRGGAAVNVLARHARAEVRVVDIGVASDCDRLPGLISRKIARGTRNFCHEAAMTRGQALEALEVGIDLATKAAGEGIGLLGTGDMGIGNTTASAAITAVITGKAVRDVTGRGTGVDDQAWSRKVSVIEQALARRSPDPADALDVLSKVGGFEIAGIAGLILGAAAARIPVVLDGFISGAAALIAAELAPACRDYLIAAHWSVECGHEAILSHLRLTPLLDLQMRLGEGTGACLGIDLVQAALKIYLQMATFHEAGVSESEGRATSC